jgi:hypothetical protein
VRLDRRTPSKSVLKSLEVPPLEKDALQGGPETEMDWLPRGWGHSEPQQAQREDWDHTWFLVLAGNHPLYSPQK